MRDLTCKRTWISEPPPNVLVLYAEEGENASASPAPMSSWRKAGPITTGKRRVRFARNDDGNPAASRDREPARAGRVVWCGRHSPCLTIALESLGVAATRGFCIGPSR